MHLHVDAGGLLHLARDRARVALAGLGAVRDEHDRRLARLSLQRCGRLPQRGADRRHAARRDRGERGVERVRIDRADRLQQVDVAAVLLLARATSSRTRAGPTFISAGMLSTRSFTTRSASCILTWPFILPAMLPEASSTIITFGLVAAGRGRAPQQGERESERRDSGTWSLLIAEPILDCEPSLVPDGSADRAPRARLPDHRAHRARRHGGRVPRRPPPAARAARAEGDPGGAVPAPCPRRWSASSARRGSPCACATRTWCSIHDFFVEDGDHFLVMEYVVGRSLGELLRERGPFSDRRDLSASARSAARGSPTRTSWASSTATSRPRT